MRSRDDDVDSARSVSRALALGVVGIGGRLPSPPIDLDDAVARVRDIHDDRMADRLARFAAVDGSAFAWTWAHGLGFRLGRIDGPWRYDPSSAAHRVDLVHVRDCRWIDVEILPAEVPVDVLVSFDRGGRNFQRIRADSAAPRTEEVWRSHAAPVDLTDPTRPAVRLR